MTTGEPTERDRYWLAHEAAIRASGQSAKAYAAERDVSLHALYQARKRLRAMGLLCKDVWAGHHQKLDKYSPRDDYRLVRGEDPNDYVAIR
jgi:hypothetical protein